MKKIILDTNFLLIPLQFKVDIFSEFNRICNFNYELFIFEKSIEELKNIIENQMNASELSSVECESSTCSRERELAFNSLARSATRTRSQLSGKDKRAAQFALKLIKLKNVGVIKSKDKDVDLLLLNIVNDDTIIATQDLNLKKQLLKKGASVIILRQKKHLQLIEGKLYK